MRALVLLDGVPGEWLRIEGGVIVARGEGSAAPDPADDRVFGIVPSIETIVHSLAGAGLTEAQARGAARIALAETSVVPIETLHVAVGREIDGARTTVAINLKQMAARIERLAAAGFDPDGLVPAVLVPPEPAAGFVRAVIGDDPVVRGVGAGFADDAVLTPLLTQGEIATLSQEATDAAMVAAVSDPLVNLRQGAFAKHKGWSADRTKLGKITWLAAACVVTLLLVPPAELISLTTNASAIERRTVARVQAVLPTGSVVVNPVEQIDEKLGAVGLQSGGFLALSQNVARALESVPGVEIDRLGYTGNEGLKLSLRVRNTADYQPLVAKITAHGLRVRDSGSGDMRELVVTQP